MITYLHIFIHFDIYYSLELFIGRSSLDKSITHLFFHIGGHLIIALNIDLGDKY